MNTQVIIFSLLLIITNALAIAEELPPSLSPGTLNRQFEQRPEPQSSGKIILLKPLAQLPANMEGDHRFTLRELNVQGGSVYTESALAEYYQHYLNTEIDVSVLFIIANKITRRYADDGYALSMAYVPAQEIEQQGLASIVIVEGYVENIVYTGAEEQLSARAKRRLNHLLTEKPLTTATLEQQLLLINDAPGTVVATTIDHVALTVGGTQLIVNVGHQLYDYYIGSNNRGSQAAGPRRFDAGVNVNDWLGADSSFGLRVQRTNSWEESAYTALFYSKVLTDSGSLLNLQFSDNQAKPDVDVLRLLEFESTSRAYSARLTQPLIRSRQQNLRASATLESKNTEGKLLGITNSDEKIRALRLGLTYDWIGQYDAQNLIQTVISKGLGLWGATDNNDPLKGAEDTDFGFWAIRVDAYRNQRISNNSRLVINATVQYASDPLSSAEQCGFGGQQLGRAYDSFELAGDHCLLIGLELQRTWRMPLANIDFVQAYGFWEGAQLWNRVADSHTDQKWSDNYGLGLRSQWFHQHRVYLEVAVPHHEKVQQEDSQQARVFVGWQMTF